jgi:hypothetical protein
MDGGGQFSQEVHSDQARDEKTPITREQKIQEKIRDKKNLPFLRPSIIAVLLSKWDVPVFRKTAVNRDRVFMTSPRIMVFKRWSSRVSRFQICK